MKSTRFSFLLFALGMVGALAGCASYDGRGLKVGESGLEDVVKTMGEPLARWKDVDGREQLAYPKGPAGLQTFMVYVLPAGHLEKIEPVLNYEHFSQIVPEKMSTEDVFRLLGPSLTTGTAYFKARDELVWEWRFCDAWGQTALFDVLFDGTTKRVRSTMQRPELMGPEGVALSCGR